MRKSIIFFGAILLFGSFCEDPPVNIIDDKPQDWKERANQSFNSLINIYWSKENDRFYSDNFADIQLNYWWQAHGLDALVDASNRVRDDSYFEYISDFYEGIDRANGGFINDFYDDMCWMGLSLLRAYQLTGVTDYLETSISLWEDIKGGWNETHGGGVAWNKNMLYYKNTPSNAPAAILSFRLYKQCEEEKYLTFGNAVLNWQYSTLVDHNTGLVWDGIGRNESDLIDYNWVFTYTQGVFIGACIECFDISKDSAWIDRAVKTADNALYELSGPSNALKDEGSGDGGLFKGILVRYLAILSDTSYIEQGKYDRYTSFLEENATVLWDQGRSSNFPYLFNSDWTTYPEGSIDLSIYLSGLFLIETIAAFSE